MRGTPDAYGVFAALALAGLLLCSGCLAQAAAGPASQPVSSQPTAASISIEQQAAQEATAIIERAMATAMVLEAQVKATQLVQQAEQVAANAPLPAETPTPGVGFIIQATSDPNSVVQTAGDEEYKVEVINITYGGEGGFIVVNFYATIRASNDFWPGRVSVTDEATGSIYEEVPTMPIIGPLIGRPKEPGQPGYVMFVNSPPGLPPGSLVTVKLGEFVQEHVVVGE